VPRRQGIALGRRWCRRARRTNDDHQTWQTGSRRRVGRGCPTVVLGRPAQFLPTCLCQFRSLSRWSVSLTVSARHRSLTGWLMDTNVLSFGPVNRHCGPKQHPGTRARRRAFSIHHTAAEIEAGIAKLHRTGAPRRAERFAEWLDRFWNNIPIVFLSFDLPGCADRWRVYRCWLRLKEGILGSRISPSRPLPCTSAHHPDRQSASLSAARVDALPVRLELRRWISAGRFTRAAPAYPVTTNRPQKARRRRRSGSR